MLCSPESRQALISYQDDHTLLLTLAGWRDIGFQNADPTSDLRAAGLVCPVCVTCAWCWGLLPTLFFRAPSHHGLRSHQPPTAPLKPAPCPPRKKSRSS